MYLLISINAKNKNKKHIFWKKKQNLDVKEKRHVFQRYWNNVKDKNNAPPAHTQKKQNQEKLRTKKLISCPEKCWSLDIKKNVFSKFELSPLTVLSSPASYAPHLLPISA